MHMCKKWEINLMEESILDEPNIEDEIDLVDSSSTNQNDPIQEMMTTDEQAELGFYNVSKILKHKFQNGWKFLVEWEGFPISASTWEPVKAFLLPKGSVNAIFEEYCEEHGLTQILQKALNRFLRSTQPMHTFCGILPWS